LAIADDGNALSWNLAGLPSLRHHEVVSSYADLFGIGIKNNTIGYVFPLADHYAFGFDWRIWASRTLSGGTRRTASDSHMGIRFGRRSPWDGV